MKKTLYSLLALASLTGMSSCHIYQKYELPSEEPIVSDYAKALEETPDSASLPYLGWREVFTDPLLQGYITQALDQNTDLENARLNVEIARAQVLGARLSYFPSLAINPNGGTASYGGSHMDWSYTIPAAASWEVDIFAKLLNNKRKAEMTLQMTEDYRQAAQSQIVCGVASTYYSLVLLHQQLDLSKRTAAIWKDQVETMELMKNAGRVNEAAVVQSRANYYSILGSIPELEQQIAVTEHAFSLLLKTYPQQWSVNQDLDFALPAEMQAHEGVAMSYLATRPDVRAAERNFAVAYYATNRARASFYPSLNISAQGGFTNLLGSIIVNPGKWFVQLAGSLTAPIFSRGQNIATLQATKLQQKQALNSFQQAVLGASADVADALVKMEKSAQKREMVLLQIDQLEKSVEYTSDLLTYGNRGTTYLEVLTARSSLLNAQLSSLACWHSRVTAAIALYRAVGGGR